ncbi:MAG: chemotaxis protein CheB [Halobacteriales archaeon]|nr:chemotaxis protein CheB [Halobacteriales archaeon]
MGRAPSPGTGFEARMAAPGDEVQANRLYYPRLSDDFEVAAGRIVVVPRGGTVHPNIDRLFRSLARAYGKRVVAVLLSGMGREGVDGLRAVQEAGGRTLVETPEAARFPNMPRAAGEAGVAMEVLPAGRHRRGRAPRAAGASPAQAL